MHSTNATGQMVEGNPGERQPAGSALDIALGTIADALSSGVGEHSPAIVEAPAAEALAFAVHPTRAVLPAGEDLIYFCDDLTAVGPSAIVRLASCGLSETGQAVWAVIARANTLCRFYAPEEATRDELAVWAQITVIALTQSGHLPAAACTPPASREYPTSKS